MRRKTLLNSAVTLFLLKKQHWYNFWGCHLGCKLALQIPSEKPLTGHAYLSPVSHFRPSEFWTVEGPDAHRAMRADSPGGQRDPAVATGTQRVPLGICISSLYNMSISSGNFDER